MFHSVAKFLVLVYLRAMESRRGMNSIRLMYLGGLALNTAAAVQAIRFIRRNI